MPERMRMAAIWNRERLIRDFPIAHPSGFVHVAPLIGDGIDSWLTARRAAGWIAAAGLIVLGIAAVKFWIVAGLGWWARVHATLLFLASVTFISFASWAHLLSTSLKF
jgi:hypothetical protein